MTAPVEITLVLELAEKHIRRYRRQLERAMAGVQRFRADENQKLLDLWVSVKAKSGDWSALTLAERNEVLDAFVDEQESDGAEGPAS